tara:strand:+ start:12035 stop:12298 length:264 start_codon:yes stop_codon:yes gene_type:complete
MTADTEDGGGPIIRITLGRKGDAMAVVEHLEWHEPDGHELTGYAAAVVDLARPAPEVLARFPNGASIALASDDLWNPAWGELHSETK